MPADSALNGSSPSAPAATSVRGNIRELFNFLAQYPNEAAANTPEAADAIKTAFRDFLVKSNYKLAAKNFDALLAEKSGDKAYRSDGTVNWYHEVVPILMILDLAKKGRKGGGFNLKDLEPYGGLEVLIITHLRHDSAEDFISKKELLQQMKEMCAEIKRENPNHSITKSHRQMLQSMHNIDLMTQQRLFDPSGKAVSRPDGKQDKENLLDFSQRMVNPKISNPIVIMLKIADLTHNAATLHGAAKFTPQKIQDRCDKMEDMYGSRFGITGKAKRLWPEFAEAITRLDHTMKAILYPHFRYLQNVDLHYKEPSNYPVGTEDYMDKATTWSLPNAFSPLHLSFLRTANSVDPVEEPLKFDRLQNHMRNVILPAIAPWKQHFPFFFKANDNNESSGGGAAHNSSVA